MQIVNLTLTRRNLLALLEKLDRVKAGGHSDCTIIKGDTVHPTHPLTGADVVSVYAVEDEVYYVDRNPGPMANLGEVK